jgi:hypothetical protein
MEKINANKSPGPDSVHPRLLYELRNEIVTPLLHIFNSSLKNKMLPMDWKCANIAAIYKKGKKNELNNYRPVSLTCIVCKMLESIVRDKILSHFVHNKFFSNKQFGFLKGRSTVTQLLNVLDKWTEMLESGGRVDVIYTDFEKAFDKVPHSRLLSKLYSYGVDKELILWVKSFLSQRKQRVVVNGMASSWADVLSGIPQGSILGPLLFIIYINDLIESCGEDVLMFLFADDAKIFRHIRNEDDSHYLQNQLDKFVGWTDKWLVKVNATKCKVLSVHHRSYPKNFVSYEYNIANIILEHVDQYKDLGVVVDSAFI